MVIIRLRVLRELHAGLVESDGREGARERGDICPERLDLRHRRGARREGGLEVLELLACGLLQHLRNSDAAVEKLGHLVEISLSETTGGEGRGTHADAARGHGAHVARDGVFVGGDVGALEHALDTRAVDASRLLEVDEDEVVVGAAADKLVALGLERLGKLGRVAHDLLLILLVLRGGRLLEGGGEGRDGVVVRAALEAREDREVDLILQIVHNLHALLGHRAHALAVENHGTARAAERLVGGGGHDVRVIERRRNAAGGDEARDVSHVREQPRAVLVSDLAHALVVDQARVGRGAGDKELRAVKPSVGLESVVVNDTSGLVKAIWQLLEVHRHGRDLLRRGLVTVRKVAAVRKVKAHDAPMRLQDRSEDLEVGRRARERLHVHAPFLRVEVEGLEGAVLAHGFDLVDLLVAAVVAGAWVALRVLVGHD
mmetsp:Transcript_15044/g.39547  ORF Transcript_15044/g.39547 Transcript_15044/m.39547 type:complete len:430 (+) Transcript_15044:388-1677(+)